MSDSIQPTPQNAPLGGLAEMLEYLRTQANKKTLIPRDSWLAQQLGGAGEIGNLIFGKSPEEVKEWSYGNAPLRLPPAGTGGYVPDFKRSLSVDEKTGDRVPGNTRSSRSDSLADALFAAQPALPLAKAAPRAVEGALNAVARNALQPVPRRQAQLGAVRLKGGNFGPEGVDNYLHEGLGLTGAPGPTADWAKKQLRNYITKDLGSTSDPLLAVEKEYPNLHLPEDALPDYPQGGSLFHSPEHRDAHRALTSENLTPWGFQADSAVDVGTVGSEMKNWVPETIPDWMRKADPASPFYNLDPHSAEQLGFRHVLDYLEAAQKPYKDFEAPHREMYGGAEMSKEDITELQKWTKSILEGAEPGEGFDGLDAAELARWRGLHNAGLTLTPEQVARTSVADAVRKTAQWNAFQANQMTEAAPGLAKGIAAVHKEYPEEGMRWVKLGKPEMKELPGGYNMGLYEGSDEAVPLFYATDVAGNKATSGYPTEEQVFEELRKSELSAGLNAEGEAMGHCVGGYCDDVASRGTEIYSLRDAKGMPHVTVEVRPGEPANPDYEDGPGGLTDWAVNNLSGKKWQAALEARMSEGDVSPSSIDSWVAQWVQENDPKGWTKLQKAREGQPPSIQQIKGKQNAAPVDKYLPFVQDFVKSGQWGRVGDLGNTGLYDLTKGAGLEHNGSPAASMFFDAPHIGKSDRVALWGAYQRAHPNDKFVTQKEVLDWAKMNPDKHGAELRSLTEMQQEIANRLGNKGYAHGGSVAPKFSKKAALLARLNSR